MKFYRRGQVVRRFKRYEDGSVRLTLGRLTLWWNW